MNDDKLYMIKKSTLVDIANAVRNKTGSTDLIKVSDLDDAVANMSLSSGGSLIDVEQLPIPSNPSTIQDNNVYRLPDGSLWSIVNGAPVEIKNNTLKKYFMYTGGARALFEDNLNIVDLTGYIAYDDFVGLSYIDLQDMCSGCSNLVTFPDVYFSPYARIAAHRMFKNCTSLQNIPELRGFSAVAGLFYGCSSLVTVPLLDLNEVTTEYSNEPIFGGCTSLTNVTLKNIRINPYLSDGSTYGNNLTVDSLINTCKECIKLETTKTLTIGAVNWEKIANIYVKFVDSTQTEIKLEEKGEVEVCESSDTGAMLISDYMALKN